MKFTFEKDKNYFKCFDEARGVAMNKKYILKNKKVNVFSYTDYIYSIFCIILFIGIGLICIKNYDVILLGYLLVLFDILLMIVTFISTYIMYNYCKKRRMPLEVIVDKEGIINSSFYGIKMIFNWDKIKAIIVKKNSVTVLTDTPIYFYFDKRKETKLIKEIKKYKPKIIVIKNK